MNVGVVVPQKISSFVIPGSADIRTNQLLATAISTASSFATAEIDIYQVWVEAQT